MVEWRAERRQSNQSVYKGVSFQATEQKVWMNLTFVGYGILAKGHTFHRILDIVLQMLVVLTAGSTSQGLGREWKSWFQDYCLGKIPTKNSKNEACDLESEALGYFFPLAM